MTTWITLLAQQAPQPEAARGPIWLGFLIIGIVIVLAAALAYLIGQRRKERGTCPQCGAPRKGTFCAKCGAHFT